MKRPGLTLHLASATLFLALTASPVAAQDMMAPPAGKGAKGAPTAPSAEQTTDLMKRFDRDGDGLLDEAERGEAKKYLANPANQPAAKPAASAGAKPAGGDKFRSQLLELFDRNKDGRLDEEERAAAQKFNAERGGEMRSELLKRFDKNGNGRLDEDERPAAQEAMRRRVAEQVAPVKPVEKPADELAGVLRAAVQADAKQRQRFDTNRNGKLDDEEWAAARSEIQRWAAEPPAPNAAAAKTDENLQLESVAAEVAKRRKKEKPKQD